MRRSAARRALILTCSLAVMAGSLLAARPALALRQFRDEFYVLYLDEESTAEEDVAYVELVRGARCNLCHVGRNRKMRNVYGEALSELLDHDTDKENVEKIQEAIRAVAELKSNPDDPESPTFGELIEQRKLPAPSDD